MDRTFVQSPGLFFEIETDPLKIAFTTLWEIVDAS